MNLVTPYAKAITAAIISGLTALSAYLVNDTAFGDITAGQWVLIAIAFLVALGAVWAVPNAEPSSPEPTPPSRSGSR